jgi:hypothetical protein
MDRSLMRALPELQMIDLLRLGDPQRELQRWLVSGRACKFMQHRARPTGCGSRKSLTRIVGHLSPRAQSRASFFGLTILRANHRTAGYAELLAREDEVPARFSPRIGFEIRYFSGAQVSVEDQLVAGIKERAKDEGAIGRAAIGPHGGDLYIASFGRMAAVIQRPLKRHAPCLTS